MTKANTQVVAKVAAVIAGLALVATAFAPAARAQSSADLEAQIQALTAQLAALQAQSGGSASASMTFTRDLTIGSTGADVTALQNFLISAGHTIPAGATGYFGAQTQAALAAYQAANAITPAAGYFGPITRAKVNASGGGSVGGGDDDDDDDGELGGGEASLENLSASDGEEDEVDQGSSGEVAEFEFDVEDADIEIQRLDLTFDSSAVDSGDDDEPWDVFDMVTLWMDGEEVASEDVSDEDEWLDDDGTNGEYVFRFTGLDTIVREGETGTIIVEVEANDGSDFDEASPSGQATWELYIDTDGLRGTDGEGIEQYLGDSTENVTFDVVEEGSDDELTVRRSSNDPESTTLMVEDDGRSDWHTVFVFELEADEDGGDIELETLPIDFTVATGEDVDAMINDVELVIGGETFDDFDWNGTGGAGDVFASTTFDIDGDVTIDAGETVEVEVMARFNSPTAGGYDEGDTVQGSVVGANIEAEGADDITPDGNVTGDEHTLRSTGVSVSLVDDTAEEREVDGSDNDYAEFEITLEIEAFEQDVYISATSSAFTYQIEDSTGTATSTGFSNSATVSSDADVEDDFYVIDEGSSEEITFRVTSNPPAYGESADYRMQLLTVIFNDDTDYATTQTWTASPASEYETDYAFVAD